MPRLPSIAALGWLAIGTLHLIRATSRKRIRLCRRVMRTLGPRLKEHRIGRANLESAFPEKSPARSRASCAESGITSAVFRRNLPTSTVLDFQPPGDKRRHRLHARYRRRVSAPAPGRQARLIFAAHLANWELPALIATKYRACYDGAVSSAQYQRSKRCNHPNPQRQHGHAGSHGSRRAVQARAHSAGRRARRHARRPALRERRRRDILRPPCKANPFIARLARHVDCPIHGTRVVRLPDRHRFRVDLSEAVRARAGCRGQNRRSSHHAGDYLGDRRLGARASRSVVMGTPALAVSVPSDCTRGAK